MDTADALVEERKLLNEAKYRHYMSNIDKALKNFEYSSEWADLISALGKLNKAISSHAQYQVIPRRIKISKRLAQCMHPALPSGVHLKALETYDVIFSKTGPDRLATELFIYSSGLFPLFGYAAMNVRPNLLTIYEKYFVPLGEKLRPALSGFLSGVLPGYESGLDHFERTNSLLSQVCNAVGPLYFYTCLWECIATNTTIRLPAISYLLEHYNKQIGMQDQIYIMGQNHEVMMYGLFACLNDSIILVQRNSLEFLLLGFPMHTEYLSESDLIKLVTNGLNTILRRDMSLNRRLYSWLLGTEISKIAEFDVNENEETYFEKYSKSILIKASINMLKSAVNKSPADLKPYRILMSLLDKTEIGPPVIDYILCDVIRLMALSNGNIEVTKSANSLFATFDPAYIWNFMTIMYEKSCYRYKDSNKIQEVREKPLSVSKDFKSLNAHEDKKFQPIVGSGNPCIIEICYLTEFLLETISLEMYNETTRVYLPKVFLAITQMLTIHSENMTDLEITASLKLCVKIVSRVQPMISSPTKIAPLPKKNTAAERPKTNATNENVTGLEKSKSDSKLNQSSFEDDTLIRRSNSNQYIDKKSPKKSKKAKSFSKLLELDKEIPLNDLDLPPPAKEIDSKSPGKINGQKPSAPKSEEAIANFSEENSKETLERLQKSNYTNNDASHDLKNHIFVQEFSVLQKCIKQYETFYQVFLSTQVLNINPVEKAESCKIAVNVEFESNSKIDNVFENEEIFEDKCEERINEVNKMFDTLKVNTIDRSAQLNNLLNTVVSTANNLKETKEPIKSQRIDFGVQSSIDKLMHIRLNESLRNSIKLASNLLVEMSTFPNCDQELNLSEKANDLPTWLKVLSLVACYSKGDKEVQLTAISTLFDLISLLKSQMEHTTNPGVTFVIMIPILKANHVQYVENNTRIFQLVTSILWNFLGDPTSDPSQISSLLYQLHNCLESGIVETVISNRMSNAHIAFQSQNVVENYIQLDKSFNRLPKYELDRLTNVRIMCFSASEPECSQLTESDYQSFRKFELLWHLGRDKQQSKSFDKMLLRVLDTLAMPYYAPTKVFASKWLQQSLLRGDMGRVLKPLMKIFLASNSKRISILHVHLLKKQSDDNQSDSVLPHEADNDVDASVDRDVYAISSEYGNVKYHMDSSINKKRSPIGLLQKKFFGVTIGSKNKTSNFVSEKPASLSEADSNMQLIINPLDTSSYLEIERVNLEPLSTSAPNKMESYDQNSDSDGKGSYNDTDSSSSDTEYAATDECKSKENLSSPTDLKRFAGDLDRVTELLSEHDRTRNRKTYHLSPVNDEQAEKTDVSSAEIADTSAASLCPDESHPADEYFSYSSGADVVGSFLNDLMNQVKDKCDKPSMKKNRKNRRQSYKEFENDSEKRNSSISKASTESTVSLNTTEKNFTDVQSNTGSSVSSDDNESESCEDKSTKFEKTTNKTDSNEQRKSRSESLKVDLDLEKSKQNVEILRKNVSISRRSNFAKNRMLQEKPRQFNKVHPFHPHILLYCGLYDIKQTLYAFQTLRSIISADARTFLCLSITTSIPNASIKHLLIRHRKSIYGKGFNGNITNTEFSQTYRGCMYLEVFVTVCLYFARSFIQTDVSENRFDLDDITGNCKVQLISVELLTTICSGLIDIVKEMGKGLACYIADLMAKCKLQKIVLLCLNSSVLLFSSRKKYQTLSEKIVVANSPSDQNLHLESLQIELLRLLVAVIKLEHEVTLLKTDETSSVNKTDPSTNSVTKSPTRLTRGTTNAKYLPNCLICQQPMFLAAVLSALQAEHLRHLHKCWTDLVTSSLTCFNFGSLTNIVISVIHQLCNNLDKIAVVSVTSHYNFPPDYVISQLEAITILCHYCLLDNTQPTSLSHLFNQAYPHASVPTQTSNSGQLFNNIVHSILSSPNSNDNQTKKSYHLAARNAVLTHLSRIVASVAAIWDSNLGQIRQVKQQIMEFLSPISLHHGSNFLASVAVTWQERKSPPEKESDFDKISSRNFSVPNNNTKNYLPQANHLQLSLVKLVSSIRVMPMDSFVQTLHQVVKTPPPIHYTPSGFSIEVSTLELFYFYMESAPAPQLTDSWTSFLALLRDGLSLPPPAQFVLLMLLNQFVQRCPEMPFHDKKDLRDLHDITSRLVEAISNVAGACLEQTTWLRRNLAVKEDISPNLVDGNLKELSGNQQYSVQAQSVLAAVLATLLDFAFGSQEKDKIVAIITTLMYNITPYLKNHTLRNIPSFYACSNLLANLSSYQYTRKAWRKEMLDLLLDQSFFQMDISCLPFWKQILDNLMTFDNTTFRELMSRVSLAQTALNIFSSREQEYEQRAILLKRLAFVIFCSEVDQYHKYMPEIQEQLANSLRLPSVVPSVQAAVFLCFRVLLLRMSPDHVTSLWPIIIAEMVQVLLAIEQELKSEDEWSQQLRTFSGIDAPWATSSANGATYQTHLTHWRTVQLEASKLLELGCVLPATNLPHFQMYRWAFVGTEFDAAEEQVVTNGHIEEIQLFNGSGYVPHVRRIARLMDMKYPTHSPMSDSKRGKHLVLTCQQITTLQDLYTFFSTLSALWPSSQNFSGSEEDISVCLAEIEHILALDFLEKMPSTAVPR